MPVKSAQLVLWVNREKPVPMESLVLLANPVKWVHQARMVP